MDCGGPPPQPPAGAGPGGGGGGFAALFAQAPCDPKPGINRAVWNFRANSPIPAGAAAVGGGPGGGGFGGGGIAAGLLVDPGEYTVKIAHVTLPQAPAGGAAPAGPPAGGPQAMQGQTKWESSKKVVVEEDPRVVMSDADRAARRDAVNKLLPVVVQTTLAQRAIVQLRQNVVQAQEAWRRPGMRVPEELRKAVDEFLKKIDDVYPLFANLPGDQAPLGDAGPPRVERPLPLPNRLNQIFGALTSWPAPPTATQLAMIPELTKALTDAGDKVRKLVQEDLPAINKQIHDANMPFIQAPTGLGGGRRGGGPEEFPYEP
jgi:hypothetical protein